MKNCRQNSFQVVHSVRVSEPDGVSSSVDLEFLHVDVHRIRKFVKFAGVKVGGWWRRPHPHLIFVVFIFRFRV